MVAVDVSRERLGTINSGHAQILIELSTSRTYSIYMIKNEMKQVEIEEVELSENEIAENIQIVKSVLKDKNLKCLVDFQDTFNVVSVDEETFTLKDSAGELYHFWLHSVMCADGWLTAVCYESDAEFEFDLEFHDESIEDVVE